MLRKYLSFIKKIQDRILSWYAQNKRDLPWRKACDPYAIWVSEIMLQQTQVKTVIPYYLRWIKHFPTLQKLANASIDQVLKLWEGLGYYARARNLHKGARAIVQKHHGHIPHTAKGLIQIPGIGPYTANAIASIAFDENVPVVDGNVHRVISRVFCIRNDLKKIHRKADDLLPDGKAGTFNQALMELGAIVCTPQKPSCGICPIKKCCVGFSKGIQESLPVSKNRVIQKSIKTVAGLIWHKGKILIHRRPLDNLLGGLWEFPSIHVTNNKDIVDILKKFIHKATSIHVLSCCRIGSYKHIYTHLKESLFLYECSISGRKIRKLNPIWKWVLPHHLNRYAFTGVCAKARKELVVISSVFKKVRNKKYFTTHLIII